MPQQGRGGWVERRYLSNNLDPLGLRLSGESVMIPPFLTLAARWMVGQFTMTWTTRWEDVLENLCPESP